MRLTELWETKKSPTLSFELLPAKTPEEEEKFEKPVNRILALDPDFVSITFGAGGSTRKGSLALAENMKSQKRVEVLSYFAAYGLGPDDITAVLDDLSRIGVDNLLAVRGDQPRDLEGFQPHPDSFDHASDLIAYIRPGYSFCIGAAGYPEGHVQAESKEKDIEYTELKVQNGAEFIVCNYFYDNQFFFDFVKRCRNRGIGVPILPGVMPIYSVKMMKILSSICGAAITDKVKLGLADLPDGDKDALVSFGIDIAVEQCKGLLEEGVPGLHFYTMNRSKSVKGIVERLRAERFLA